MLNYISIWSRKAGCIVYFIFSTSTWTREIWLEYAWVDLYTNKFGDSAGEDIDLIYFVFDLIYVYKSFCWPLETLPPLYFVFEECLASSRCSLDHYKNFFPYPIGYLSFTLLVSSLVHLGCVNRVLIVFDLRNSVPLVLLYSVVGVLMLLCSVVIVQSPPRCSSAV